MKNEKGIRVSVLGDYGPFSTTGKSIGYLVEVEGASFLLDCGSPLFGPIGGHKLAKLDGLIVTHCHDDHKRWFTDLAIFHHYAPDVDHPLRLFASETVLGELNKASGPALDRSLSDDSKRVIDLSYEDFVSHTMLGPRARYRIVERRDSRDRLVYTVEDLEGRVLGPDEAKVVISEKTGRRRLLFKDPKLDEWVEPDCFYPFSSTLFYEEDRRIYQGRGFVIEAVKAPVWHGLSGIGVRFSTGNETLLFTSDTVHDLELWERLASDKHTQNLGGMSRAEFEAARVIVGDINDYIERTWSPERYQAAVDAFDEGIVIQDISSKNSIVHTDYERLEHTVLKPERTILTHCPDRMTSEWILCYSGKAYRIVEGMAYEESGDKLFPLNADIYHKEEGRYYVGYRSDNGKYPVYKNDEQTVRVLLNDSYYDSTLGEEIYRVDLYEDVGGEYFPVVDRPDEKYYQRPDGRVELLKLTATGSSGTVVQGLREKLEAARRRDNLLASARK